MLAFFAKIRTSRYWTPLPSSLVAGALGSHWNGAFTQILGSHSK